MQPHCLRGGCHTRAAYVQSRAPGRRLAGSRCSRRAPAAAPRPAPAAAAAAATNGASAAGAALQLPRVVAPAQQFAELRAKLCRELLAGGLVWLAAGELLQRNGDVFHAYRPHSDFFYATGISEPGWGCLLDVETGHLTLVAPRIPEEAAIWSGPLPSLDQIAADAGANAAIYKDDLRSFISNKTKAAAAAGGGAPLLHTLDCMLPALAAAGVEGGDAAGVRVTTDFLAQALARSRARKTGAEIACLLEANRVSAAAHEAIWARCSPGVYEYQLEAAFTAACIDGGLRQLGYPCIVGAGPNAGVLHYERNSSAVAANDMVLVDAGAEFRCYTADITRTFPASGAFTPQARSVYDLSLGMQAVALRGIAPGADWRAAVEEPARRLMLEGLRDMGLVKGDVEAMLSARVDRIFCPHGLGHHLGLDVHDTSEHGPVPKVPLEPGFVLTCEPGVYFMPLLVERAMADDQSAKFLVADELQKFMGLGGVRIEDNVALLPSDYATSNSSSSSSSSSATSNSSVSSSGSSSGGGGGSGGVGAGVLNLTVAAGRAPKGAAEIEAVMGAAREAAAAAAGARRR